MLRCLRIATTGVSADERLWTWLAVSRGARGLTFGDWRASGNRAGGAWSHQTGQSAIAPAPPAASRESSAVTRRSLRHSSPRPARIAIVYDPRSPMDAPVAVSLSTVYRALFERNIQVDFIHLDEIAAGVVSRYAVVVVGSPSTLPQPAADALKAHVAAGGAVISGSTPAPTDRQIAEVVPRGRQA